MTREIQGPALPDFAAKVSNSPQAYNVKAEKAVAKGRTDFVRVILPGTDVNVVAQDEEGNPGVFKQADEERWKDAGATDTEDTG